jgi:2-polyprenyl-6-methoxyphenol hydroxylase-like FAD-dependent oxidoreductase
MVKNLGLEVTPPNIVIAGGSLSGLTLALASARRGVRTRVLERTRAGNRTGGALGIDRKLLAQVTGIDPSSDGPFPHLAVITSYREASSWLALHNWLRNQALRSPQIRLTEGASVQHIRLNEHSVEITTSEDETIEASIVVGADGYRSIVRQTVNPERPFAKYSGYMLWRGLVNERELPRSTSWPDNQDGLSVIDAAGFRLISYPVPGMDGSLKRGERQISFAWYDTTRDALLQELHCLSPEGYVLATVSQDRIPQGLRAELLEFVRDLWPEPWLDFVVHSIRSGGLFGTPICEYRPDHLVRDRAVIIGDAAHVASPMTGLGFATAAVDADVLAETFLAAQSTGEDIPEALRRFEKSRLSDAQHLAATSMQWSRKYLQLASRAADFYRPTVNLRHDLSR